MSRSIFTTEDMKNICENTFNGNLREYLKSNKTIAYDNVNTENILTIDADDGEQTTVDLAEHLNINFYTWRKRLVDSGTEYNSEQLYTYFDDWAKSLNLSLNRTYALVETIDESVLASEDITSATKNCQITFLVPINLVKNLEYYCAKIRANYLGKPQDMRDKFGNDYKAYILWGTLIYDTEPMQTQLGECIIATLVFKLSYISSAISYADMKIEMSLDGTTYTQLPITNMGQQAIVANTPLPKANNPALTGFIGTSISGVRTITLYDYVTGTLPTALRTLFYKLTARSENSSAITRVVNTPIWFKITPDYGNGSNTYYTYKELITDISMKIMNGDFNILTLTSKTWGLD